MNHQKLNMYIDKLYREESKWVKQEFKRKNKFRYSSGILIYESRSRSGNRIPVTSSQGMMIVKKCNSKCDVCGLKYVNNPSAFEIHHIDGDKSNSVMSNLTFLCKICHSRISTEVRAKIRDLKLKLNK